MAAEKTWYLDISNGVFVTSLNDATPLPLNSLFQGADFIVKLWPVIPTGIPNNPFTKAAITSLQCKMAIGPNAGATALLAYQGTWTQVPDAGGSSTGYLTAEFNLNTNEMNAAIGNNASINSYFEIQIADNGLYQIVYQKPITILSAVIDPTGAGSLPSASVRYMTWDDMRANCVLWTGNGAGKNIDLVSPDGVSHRILGVKNDKSGLDDLL